MSPRVPSYFDFLIRDFNAGHLNRHVHLGRWDRSADPQGVLTDFGTAQIMLDESLVGMAQIGHGLSVLDVGCGFGGTLERINASFSEMTLIGLNIDSRQVAICDQLRPTPGNHLSWICSDAVRLPVQTASVDRVLCVEAMPHFASRSAFMEEAARVLRPGGRLVASDILVDHRAPEYLGITEAQLRRAFDQGLGPWPDPFPAVTDLVQIASRCGLTVDEVVDATAETVPSHRYTAPAVSLPAGDPRTAYLDGARMLATLHADGFVVYPYLSFVRADK